MLSLATSIANKFLAFDLCSIDEFNETIYVKYTHFMSYKRRQSILICLIRVCMCEPSSFTFQLSWVELRFQFLSVYFSLSQHNSKWINSFVRLFSLSHYLHVNKLGLSILFAVIVKPQCCVVRFRYFPCELIGELFFFKKKDFLYGKRIFWRKPIFWRKKLQGKGTFQFRTEHRLGRLEMENHFCK